jgi:biotin operon repressor
MRTDRRIEMMWSLYDREKLSLEQIGRRFGLTRQRVHQLLKAAGYTMRSRPHSGTDIEFQLREQAVRLRRQGLGCFEISSQLGLTPRQVWSITHHASVGMDRLRIFTHDDVRRYYRLARSGEKSLRALAQEVGCRRQTMSKLVQRRTYKWVDVSDIDREFAERDRAA